MPTRMTARSWPYPRRLINERGFYTLEEFLAPPQWTAARSVHRCEPDARGEVEYATRVALSPENDFAQLHLEILSSLQGVGWPMASVLLHFSHKGPYPIPDFRALWSLGLDEGAVDRGFSLDGIQRVPAACLNFGIPCHRFEL
jgi:hypothetical protein